MQYPEKRRKTERLSEFIIIAVLTWTGKNRDARQNYTGDFVDLRRWNKARIGKHDRRKD